MPRLLQTISGVDSTPPHDGFNPAMPGCVGENLAQPPGQSFRSLCLPQPVARFQDWFPAHLADTLSCDHLSVFLSMVLGELLPESAKPFNPALGLAWGDVALDNQAAPRMVQFHLKHSKCDQFGAGSDIVVGVTGAELYLLSSGEPARGPSSLIRPSGP